MQLACGKQVSVMSAPPDMGGCGVEGAPPLGRLCGAGGPRLEFCCCCIFFFFRRRGVWSPSLKRGCHVTLAVLLVAVVVFFFFLTPQAPPFFTVFLLPAGLLLLRTMLATVKLLLVFFPYAFGFGMLRVRLWYVVVGCPGAGTHSRRRRESRKKSRNFQKLFSA